MHPVVADPQVGRSGAFPLAGLERFEERIGVGGQAAQLVELGVVARGEHSAVADQHRRGVHHRAVEQGGDVRKFAVLTGQLPNAGTVGAGERFAQSRHRMQRATKLREVARTRRREPDARQDALEIPDIGEEPAHGLVRAVLDQGPHRVQALRELLAVAYGSGQPAAQEPASHRRLRAVHDRGERRGVVAGQRVGDFQIAARDRIEDQSVVVPLETHRAHVRQRAALRVPGVDDQRPRRPGRDRTILELEPREIVRPELLDEDPAGRRRVEVPRRDSPQRRVLAHRGELRRALAEKDLGGAEPFDLGLGALGVGGLGADEPAARELESRDAPASRRAVNRREEVVAVRLEQVLVGQGPRRDDAGDPPLHRPARLRGIPDLLANRGRFALAHQLREIGFDRMRGHSGHGDRNSARTPARGERDVEQLRGTTRVVEEQLVEVPHPIEEQGVGMLCLDAQVLRDDGGVPGRGVGGHGHRGRAERFGRCGSRSIPR